MKQQNLTIFVKRDLLTSQMGCELLREYLMFCPKIKKYTKISGISDGKLDIKEPPIAFRDAHIYDRVLCAHEAEAIISGYIELSIESLKVLLSMPI